MSMTPAPAEDLVVLGKIVSVHGVKGDVKVYSFTEPLTNVLNYPHWTLKRDGEVKQVEVASGRLQGKVLVAKLKGLDDREVARTFAGFDIWNLATAITTGISWKVSRSLIRQGNCSARLIICLRLVPTM
jgi:ribosomal 30S subunit maturation factor RimM